jgi:hypothetical protein
MADILSPVKVQELEDGTVDYLQQNGGYVVIASTDSAKPPQKLSIAKLAELIGKINPPQMSVVGYAYVLGNGSVNLKLGIISSVARVGNGVYDVFLSMIISYGTYSFFANAAIMKTPNPYENAYASAIIGNAGNVIRVHTADDSSHNDAAFQITIIKR